MALLRALLSYSYQVLIGRLVHLKLVPELRTRMFDKLRRLSFRFFDEKATGSIINRVTGDVQSLRSFVDGVLLQGVIMLSSSTGSLGASIHRSASAVTALARPASNRLLRARATRRAAHSSCSMKPRAPSTP
jgi:ABC-type multidrug transport system fused ATPase/permease subunit